MDIRDFIHLIISTLFTHMIHNRYLPSRVFILYVTFDNSSYKFCSVQFLILIPIFLCSFFSICIEHPVRQQALTPSRAKNQITGQHHTYQIIFIEQTVVGVIFQTLGRISSVSRGIWMLY